MEVKAKTLITTKDQITFCELPPGCSGLINGFYCILYSKQIHGERIKGYLYICECFCLKLLRIPKRRNMLAYDVDRRVKYLIITFTVILRVARRTKTLNKYKY